MPQSWLEFLRFFLSDSKFIHSLNLNFRHHAIKAEESHLADWKTGDLKLLKRFVQGESDLI